ncbi:hypothetical protein CY34DRAFT_16058 [Suillus luteus UH-Slu-Lm8-n1]|uniref:Uncharacterized protein n=1 Tax=Suillus luteus UH-Slu-Lm8-n1 TaxID=930992 RepID=A0A0D0ARQ4_9AGAM|nr:hypothetical protein CY34DRAFT_16058 [Suillus luteus UH-Slu-Lm8-n1]
MAVSHSTACIDGWITLQFKELFADKKPEDIALKDFHSKEAALTKTELDLQHWTSERRRETEGPNKGSFKDSDLAETQEKGELLQAERDKSQSLDGRVDDLESCSSKLDVQLPEALVQRELQLLNASLDEVRSASEQHQQHFRELEEQIESDDCAEQLEDSRMLRIAPKSSSFSSLSSNRHAAIFLSSLANAHNEKDEIQSQLQLRTDGEIEWKARHASPEEQHSSLQEHLHSANQDRDASLHSQVNFDQGAIKQLQQKLGGVASELLSSDRVPQNVHSDLGAANQLAEEAEMTQKDLQTEGMGLMQSLDEMRPAYHWG